MVSEFIELRSPTGNNRPTGNNSPARFLGIWDDFWVIWAHAMRPDGFLGYLGFLGAVFGLFGRTQFDQLTDHGAPLPLAQ